MRNLFELGPAVTRVPHLTGDLGDHQNGCFRVRKATRDGGITLDVVASCGFGWEHVSVSRRNRCPTWDEMAFVAKQFFKPDEILIQFRPAEEDYVNEHRFCLHWWRPVNVRIPIPPKWMVGGVTEEEAVKLTEEMRQ